MKLPQQPGRVDTDSGTDVMPTPSATKSTTRTSLVTTPRLWINGDEVPIRNNRERYMQVISWLAQRDSDFLQRFAAHFPAGKRPAVARTPEELFPGNPHLAANKDHWRPVPGIPGWFIDVNRSASNMVAMISLACDVAGVKFGKDIRIN